MSVKMTDTPCSRSISRSGTPALARSSPSRLSIPPALRQNPSLSNLHIHSHNATPSGADISAPPLALTSADQTLNSSASSVIDMEPAEGILIQDLDADVEQTDAEDVVSIDKAVANVQAEDTKKLLRDQLRKSLNHKVAHTGRDRILSHLALAHFNILIFIPLLDAEMSRSRQSGKAKELEELSFPGGKFIAWYLRYSY